MIQVNAMGDACPIPVVKTLRALKELNGAGAVQTLVDNRVAVENLTRLAESKGCTIETEQLGEKEYRVTITVGEDAELPENADGICTVPPRSGQHRGGRIRRPHGRGRRDAGQDFAEGLSVRPDPAGDAAQNHFVLQRRRIRHLRGLCLAGDLQKLAEQGVEILTCGTCLNHYGLTEKLRVGGVTNMYVIVEKQTQATKVIRP